MLTRDVSFREFYFSVREFVIPGTRLSSAAQCRFYSWSIPHCMEHIL